MTWNEEFAREGVCFPFDGRIKAVRSSEEVMPEFVGDRKSLPYLRLTGHEVDAVINEPRAQAPKRLDLNDLDPGTARDCANGNWSRCDGLRLKHITRHRPRVRWMRPIRPSRPSGHGNHVLGTRTVVVGNSRCSTLGALIGKTGRLVEARAALLLSAPQIRHTRLAIDYRLGIDQALGESDDPEAAVLSCCNGDSGDPRLLEGAMMDESERDTDVFQEVERLRREDSGLGDKLERYRQSRGHYERLVGRGETAPSVPLQRSRRQATAEGRVKKNDGGGG
jgi:hypothetical protein